MLAFARSARHADVLAGIAEAQAEGFERIKLNSVTIRGFNDDEVLELLEYARGHGLEAALHRVHGRGRGDPLADGGRGHPRRAAGHHRRALRCD
jgi:molybdenum cofactor biosynthesis enzyme MoaA